MMTTQNKESVEQFCKKHDIQDLSEFERSKGMSGDIFEQKNKLETHLAQLRTELAQISQ